MASAPELFEATFIRIKAFLNDFFILFQIEVVCLSRQTTLLMQ
jgi:hypothetical protein